MQNSSPVGENKEIFLQIYRVTVFLEPITESSWYEMKREQQNLPVLSEVNKRFCVFCLEEFEPASTYAKCLDCDQTEVLICIKCLRLGTESEPHRRSHRYVLCDSIGPVLFDEGIPTNSWGAQEDLQLLNSMLRAHLNQWPELSKDWGRKRSLTKALERLDRCFIRGEIGKHVLKRYTRGYVKEWNEQPNIAPTQLMPLSSNAIGQHILNNLQTDISIGKKANGTNPGAISKTPSTDEMIEMNERISGKTTTTQLDRMANPIASTSTSSPIHKRCAYFDDEDNSEEDSVEIGERKMSTKSITDSETAAETSSLNSAEQRKNRKDQLLAAAKNVAAEALRGKIRKTSLELSEAINFEEGTSGTCNKKQNSNKALEADNILSSDQLVSLYASSSFNPYFYNNPPPPMDSHTVAKFDEEDLQLLTYLPFRDEFENEYKNEAEQLISRIVFPKEDVELTEVDEFLNKVKYARFNRYNRLMRIRATKRATILEHNMLAEYLNIVKTNISERGKYTVFDDRYFSTKSREDFFKPLFFQLRQVANKETFNQLAKDIGEIETLKNQIDELKELQSKGVTKLKGRLKTDSKVATVTWSKKRKGKAKKSENTEQRKAGLRWKRIKRWTKKNHLQNPDAQQDD